MTEGFFSPDWSERFDDYAAQAWAGKAFEQISKKDPTAAGADIQATLDEVASDEKKQLRDRDPETYTAHREIAAGYVDRMLGLRFKGPTS